MLHFWKIIFFISPAFLLVMPSGHFIGPFFMSLVGLFFWRQAAKITPIVEPSLRSSWALMLGGFGIFVVVGVGLAVWHGNHAGHYQMYVPFALFPAMALIIRTGRWRAEPWLLSVALGAMLAFCYALIQIFEQKIGRATGATGNPIPFGNTAIVLSAVALIAGVMFPFEGVKARWKRVFVLSGGVAGLGASLLSGSKGGWLSVFIIGITIAYLTTHHWPLWRRHVAAFAMLVALFIAGMMAPSHVVKDRIVSGFTGGWHWIQTGAVSENSVSMRFEIWKLSLKIISEKPILGHGSVGSRQRWHELLEEGYAHNELVKLVDANPKFSTSDNEILGFLRGGGFIGLFALFAAYAGVFFAFLEWRKHYDLYIRSLGTIGLIIVPLFLEFGLSVSVFGINVFRSTFVYLSIALMSLLSVRYFYLKSHQI